MCVTLLCCRSQVCFILKIELMLSAVPVPDFMLALICSVQLDITSVSFHYTFLTI